MAQNPSYDYLIVGAGLFGATFAHFAGKHGKRCLVIDKRNHTGGNIYCQPVDASAKGDDSHIINVHKYGAHIFHTSNRKVWEFVNSIVEFNRYTNSPVACYHGKLYNLPLNMNTFSQMWGVRTPAEAKEMIDRQRKDAIEEINRIHQEKGLPPMTLADDGTWQGADNLEEQALSLVGRDIFEILIKEYTEKQWGRKCTELPAFIIRRLPVRMVFDNNYFNDLYQGIPIGGYNKLTDGLLANADVMTSTDFFEDRERWMAMADKIVFTGQIDEFYNYQLGHLEWRTVRFEENTYNTPNYQGNAVVNFTEKEVPYTRSIEHKHFEMFGTQVDQCPKTVVSREFSTEWTPGSEPYYPVNDEHNSQLAEQYRALANKEERVIFGGRLAEYKYYDMAPIVEKVMNLWGE